MDLNNSVLLLTQQAAMVVDYAFIVGMIAVIVACASLFCRSRMSEHLRQTGERHDNLQMRYFNPTHKVVVQRPEDLDAKESSKSANNSGKRHPWRTRS